MECDKSFESCSFGRSSIQRSPILQKTHPHIFWGVSWESLVSLLLAGMNIRTFRMIIYIPRHANTSVYFGGQTPAFSAGVWMSRRHVFLLPLGFLSSLSAHSIHPPPAKQKGRSWPKLCCFGSFASREPPHQKKHYSTWMSQKLVQGFFKLRYFTPIYPICK